MSSKLGLLSYLYCSFIEGWWGISFRGWCIHHSSKPQQTPQVQPVTHHHSRQREEKVTQEGPRWQHEEATAYVVFNSLWLQCKLLAFVMRFFYLVAFVFIISFLFEVFFIWNISLNCSLCREVFLSATFVFVIINFVI